MDNQIKLNQKLYSEVTADDFSLERIEALLKQGAQPLGYMDEDHEECVFSVMLCDASDHMDSDGIDDYNVARERLSKIVRLFLDYGMLNHLYYDEDEKVEFLPLWELQFCCCRDAAVSLKMILDEGYTGNSLDDFINHFFLDGLYVDPFDLNNPQYVYHLEWGLRMLMLIASYPTILEKDEYVRSCICLDKNNKNILDTFRDIDRYKYEIKYNSDMCKDNPILAFITIKDGDEIVWSIDFV